jgi:inorganic triphosphatase YgiF
MHARWLTKAAAGQVSRRQLTSLYFDTPDFALRNHGITLLVRKSDTTNLQTIKAFTGTDIVQRDEWEDEIDGDRPKLSLARETPLAPLLSDDIEKELRPVFETSVERVTMPLRFGRCASAAATSSSPSTAAGSKRRITISISASSKLS